MKNQYPVLTELYVLERMYSNKDIAIAINALKEVDPSFSLEYIDEKTSNPADVARLRKNIKSARELAKNISPGLKSTREIDRVAKALGTNK